MLCTVALGTSVLIQGIYVRTLADGRITVRVDGNHFSGKPVETARSLEMA